MINPIEMLKNFKGRNPKEIVLNQMIGEIQNPMIKNLVNMAKNGNEKDIETFARNMCKDRGLNYDEEISNFIKQWK